MKEAIGRFENYLRRRFGQSSTAKHYLSDLKIFMEALGKLTPEVHTVARSTDTYLGAQFRRLAARRGKKRAAVAVARSILVIVYHMICDGSAYVDLGVDYFDKRNQAQTERRLIKRLEQLGYTVTLESRVAA